MSYSENQTNSKEQWLDRLSQFYVKQSDMNRLIMNYLITGNFKSIILFSYWNKNNNKHFLCFSEGFKEAAEKFQKESGLDTSIDLSSLDERMLIRDAVQNGRIQEATHLVNEMLPELLDNDRYLFFHLQQLQLIELIR